MKFEVIPGLAYVKKVLVDSVQSQHIAHAQLFAGPEGALNLPLALAYATYLHCENKGNDACGTCAACSKSLKHIHPDTHFVFPVSKTSTDKDEERVKSEILQTWRDFLNAHPFGSLDDWITHHGGESKKPLISREESREIVKALSLKPFESRYKVMIIWQPELMHPTAANGILKILEEPAPHTCFILVTNAADQLLPTILSRTQIVSIPLLTDEDVKSWLTAQLIDPVKASMAAHMAAGRLNFAVELTQREEDDFAPRFAEWMRACFRKNFADLVALSEEYHQLDKLSQKNMLQYGMNALRESLVHLAGASSIHRIESEQLSFVKDFSKVLDVPKIERAYGLMNEAGYHLERNGSPKMIFMDLSLQLSNVIRT